MAKKTPEEKQRENEESLKHWRAWGSWFSWGSPVGLSIFLVACATTFWIVMQALD